MQNSVYVVVEWPLIQKSKVVGWKKNSTSKVKGNERFFILFFFHFWFRLLFEKMIAVPPGSRTVSKKIWLVVNSEKFKGIKNMFH